MTNAIAPDFPDFQEQAQWLDAPLVNALIPVGTTSKTYGPFLVAGWNNAQIVIFNNSPQAIFEAWTFQYSVDSAGLTQSGKREVNLDGGNSVAWIVPHLGPWLTITMVSTALTVSSTAVYVANTNRVPTSDKTSAFGIFDSFLFGTQSVPATSTVNTFSAVAAAGRAQIMWNVAAASWSIEVDYLTQLFTYIPCFYVANGSPAGSNNNQTLYLPSASLRLQVKNNDAAAKSFSIAFLPDSTG